MSEPSCVYSVFRFPGGETAFDDKTVAGLDALGSQGWRVVQMELIPIDLAGCVGRRHWRGLFTREVRRDPPGEQAKTNRQGFRFPVR